MAKKEKPFADPPLFGGSSGFRFALGLCAMLFVVALLIRSLDAAADADKQIGSQSSATRRSAPSFSTTTRHAVDRNASQHLPEWVQTLRNESDPAKREELFRDMLDDLSPEEIASALVSLQSAVDDEMVNALTQRLVRRWTELDPAAASTWVTQLPIGPVRSEALDNVAIIWANQNFTEAAAWMKRLSTQSERHQVLSSIASEVVRAEPMEAIRLAVELPAGKPRDALIDRAAMEWAARDPQAAIKWTAKIPDDALRQKILAGVAIAWADQDPVAAATLAVDELPGDRTQADVLVSIAQRWAQQAPEAAAAWVERFPEGKLRLAAIENVAAMWSQKNALPAAQWLQDLRFSGLSN